MSQPKLSPDEWELNLEIVVRLFWKESDAELYDEESGDFSSDGVAHLRFLLLE